MVSSKLRRLLSGVTSLTMVCILLAMGGCDILESEPPEPVELSLDGIDILATQSGDLLVQSGEVVRLDAFLTNRSSSPIDSVGFEVESDDLEVDPEEVRTFIAGVEVFNDRATLGVGESVRVNVVLRVPPNTPAGTAGTVEIGVTGAGGRSGTATGEVRTVALRYEPTVSGTTVVSDTDGDGRAEPGESVTVEVALVTGSDRISDGCFDYRTTSALTQVTVTTTSERYNCGNGAVTNPSFSFRAASVLSSGAVLPFTLRLEDRYENTWDLPVSVTLG